MTTATTTTAAEKGAGKVHFPFEKLKLKLILVGKVFLPKMIVLELVWRT